MAVKDIYDAVIGYDEDRVLELVKAEVAAGTDVAVILNHGMITALDEIGRKFSEGTVFVPEMLRAAEAAQAGLNVLRPLLAETGAKPKGTVVIGTVKGDLHDIGKNLVAMMLEGAGFRLVDLGTDVAPEVLLGKVRRAFGSVDHLAARDGPGRRRRRRGARDVQSPGHGDGRRSPRQPGVRRQDRRRRLRRRRHRRGRAGPAHDPGMT